ncbi:MAG TPA: MXAN_2562 family outer membrane beta-barrel protein, partial [Kofleriaceae bacterium]
WEDPDAQAALDDDENIVTWNAGIRLGPYIPDVDAGLMKNGSGQGPYHAMFGDYFDEDGNRVAKHVWQVLPMLDVDRILWRGFGQLGVGGSIGYMQKSALAYTEDSMASQGVERDRAPGSTIKFRLIPTAATVTYRFTYLDDEWGIPVVPYLRGGLSYYIWWMKAPSGNTSRICSDGTESADCDGNKAYGGSLGYQGAIGLAIRAERIDTDAARSMNQSGIKHAGFYGELSLAKVDGFGSETKLSVGDATWFAGVNFEF